MSRIISRSTVLLAALCLVLAATVSGCAPAESQAEGTLQTTKAGTSYTKRQTAEDASGSGGEIDGSGRVHYGRMPDQSQLLVIRTDNGTTAYGKVPVIGPFKQGAVDQIRVILGGFSASRVVYVTIDGKLVGVFGENDSHADIAISKNFLESGTHFVEATQYAGDDPSAAVTLYKCAQYAVAG